MVGRLIRNANLTEQSGLALSRRLFEERGQALLERLAVVDVCSVACVGGTSQNAGIDDEVSRGHFWGPYLAFILPNRHWRLHRHRFMQALDDFQDQVAGVAWRGYGGPEPRKTGVFELVPFLADLTGYGDPPTLDADWLVHMNRQSFLGRRWTERLFDASQGEVFHDPDSQFTDQWRRYVRYPPPDIQKALVARGLFRTWNMGPEYNLGRAWRRRDLVAFAQCRSLFVNEVMELAFCWNASYVPAFKWRAAHFERLPDCPTTVREGVAALAISRPTEGVIAAGHDIVKGIKQVIGDRFHLCVAPEEPLSTYAHAVHAQIGSRSIRQAASLDW